MHAVKVNKTLLFWHFADFVWMATLTGLHELTLTPKHLGERASAAGERLLHGWAPVGGERSFVFWKRWALMVSLQVWRRVYVALEQSSVLTPQLAALLPFKPPHDFPYAFPRVVICLLQLPPLWLQICPASRCLRCRVSCGCSSADGRSVLGCSQSAH